MVFQTKDDVDFGFLHVTVHDKCLIVTMQGKNSLFEFHEADKMAIELSKYLTMDSLETMKINIEANTTKVKFTSRSNPPEQLSLF